MTRARVTAEHRPPARPVLELEAGAPVTVGELDDEWPAFRWCVNELDVGGWVPDRYLTHEQPGRARCRRAYSTRELSVDRGQGVELVERDDESGWHWCRDGAGREGWVPARSLAEGSR